MMVAAMSPPSARLCSQLPLSIEGRIRRFNAKRINHSVAFKNKDACTNQAESFFTRLRRAEIGQHHCISGRYLHSYVREMAWREDNRRQPEGSLYLLATSAALAHPVSREWKGDWQWHEAH